MICKGCGAEISSNQMFCPHCGTKNEPAGNNNITKKCMNCGKVFTSEMVFCDVCGGSLTAVQSNSEANTSSANPSGPRQMPLYGSQATPNQAQYNQNYSNMSAPNQAPPRPASPYPMPGQVPPGQMAPNMMPPYPGAPMPAKKKSPLLPIFIVVGALVILLIGAIVAVKIFGSLRPKDDGVNIPTDSGSTFENYNYYVDGRDTSAFNQYEEVYMENGIAFCLNDILATDMGDGTQVIECNIDLGASIDGCSVYSDDFIIFPMDSEGNIVGDAVAFDSIVDSDGNSLTTPVLLDTEYYYSYKISFTVPSDTDSFTFFGTNIEIDPSTDEAVASGPIYSIDIVLQ